MKVKILISMMAVLLLSVPAIAAKEMGSLDAPVLESVGLRSGYVVLDWNDVNDATKYSVDIEGTVTYYDSNSMTRVTVDVELSFGTSDRTDGGEMGDSYLAIPESDLCDAVLDALAEMGVNLDFVGDFQLLSSGKVKALDPGKGKGRQNNPFSNSMDLPDIICRR